MYLPKQQKKRQQNAEIINCAAGRLDSQTNENESLNLFPLPFACL